MCAHSDLLSLPRTDLCAAKRKKVATTLTHEAIRNPKRDRKGHRVVVETPPARRTVVDYRVGVCGTKTAPEVVEAVGVARLGDADSVRSGLFVQELPARGRERISLHD